jgi:hypothetical protein
VTDELATITRASVLEARAVLLVAQRRGELRLGGQDRRLEVGDALLAQAVAQRPEHDAEHDGEGEQGREDEAQHEPPPEPARLERSHGSRNR